MSFLHYLAIGILGAVGGILGNLLAAIIEGSLGEFTSVQAGGMIIGAILVIIISYYIEKHFIQARQKTDELYEKLENKRQEIRLLLRKFNSGASWTSADIDIWLEHQKEIGFIKAELKRKKMEVSYDSLDDSPPPQIGCLTKTIGFAQQISTLLIFPLLITFSFSFAFLISPKVQKNYLEYVATPTSTPTPLLPPPSVPTVEPTPASTPTPSFIPTVAPTPTIEFTSTPELSFNLTPAPPTTSTDTLFNTTSTPTLPTLSDDDATRTAFFDATATAFFINSSTVTPSSFRPTTLFAPPNNSIIVGQEEPIILRWGNKFFREDEYFIVGVGVKGINLSSGDCDTDWLYFTSTKSISLTLPNFLLDLMCVEDNSTVKWNVYIGNNLEQTNLDFRDNFFETSSENANSFQWFNENNSDINAPILEECIDFISNFNQPCLLPDEGFIIPATNQFLRIDDSGFLSSLFQDSISSSELSPPFSNELIENVNTSRPTLEDLQNLNSIWSLTGFRELTKPGTETYTVTVETNKNFSWAFTWCAIDEKTLNNILVPLELDLKIDNILVPNNSILQYTRKLSNDWPCLYWVTKLTRWKLDQVVKLEFDYYLQEEIYDGETYYPSGQYNQIIFVRVKNTQHEDELNIPK